MNRVVVTGMGVISPVGNDIPTFWDSLVSGKNGISLITRYDTENHKVKVAAEVKDFEPTLYMEKSALRKTDLFTQYAVGAATQAVEDSGIIGQVNEERFGVYIGSGVGGLITTVEQIGRYNEGGEKKVSPFLIPMMIGNIAAGTVAIKYHAQGPCLPVVSACATSTHAIGEAYRAIKHGYADAILAGGSEAAIVSVGIAGFTNCKALSTAPDPETACMPFDKRRHGFVMGEGAGVLVLEEYEHAKARGAKIYGEVSGYGNTCDAYHITAPHPDGAGSSRAIAEALEGALELTGLSLDSAQVYINAHGTSTPLNDKTETMAIKKALGEEHARKAIISSTKSMTGHMLGATGAVEAIASLLAMESGIIPPTINYKEPDPECDLDYTPNVARKAVIDLALSPSLGFGGHNGCLAFTKVR